MPLDPNQLDLTQVPSYTKDQYRQTIDDLKAIAIAQPNRINTIIQIINDVQYLYNYQQLHHFTDAVVQKRQNSAKKHYQNNQFAQKQIQMQMFSNRYSRHIFDCPLHHQIINTIQAEIIKLQKNHIISGGRNNLGPEHDAYIKMYMWFYTLTMRHEWELDTVTTFMYRLENRARRQLNHWYYQQNGQLKLQIKAICQQIDAN